MDVLLRLFNLPTEHLDELLEKEEIARLKGLAGNYLFIEDKKVKYFDKSYSKLLTNGQIPSLSEVKLYFVPLKNKQCA
ncbi:MAG: hypothetical protein ABIF85_01325 [Nanoarchaeota archaeon]|nr:hypothetical protein [Nanoarchaeota archaeon]MBU4451546.1 hypothetical protein [Nanoarchaeota archaeon]